MTEKPILFSGPMVRAILDGPKTQTRRVLKHQPVMRGGDDMVIKYETGGHSFSGPRDFLLKQLADFGCKYRVGDRLWVREAWRAELSWQSLKPSDIPQGAAIFYEADGSKTDNGIGAKFPGKLRPSMFMPRWASRITLEVTAVKVERLQDIREADAKAEGAEALPVETGQYDGAGNPIEQGSYRYGFKEIWAAVHGKEAWDRNDWVAAYTFRRATE